MYIYIYDMCVFYFYVVQTQEMHKMMNMHMLLV